MKFKRTKMCALNEALLQTAVEATDDNELEVVVAADPSYADAIQHSRNTRKVLNDRFKDFDANMKEFAEDSNKKVKGETKMKAEKIHLSESLFEEAVTFEEPTSMGRGACAPLVSDFRRTIKEYVSELETADPEEVGLLKGTLRRYVKQLLDQKQSIENFDEYWAQRYPACIDFVDSQLQLLGDSLLRELLSTSDELDESKGLMEDNEEDAPSTKKRTRSSNQKKERRNYSSEDLWLAVYDELCATVDNEGEGQEVNKQVKAKRGERYEKVFPHGDSDIIIYATKPEEFEFARRVADYYGVVAEEPKEDKNKSTNGFYKYTMIIRIPEEDLYQGE